jgi:acylphosphatase
LRVEKKVAHSIGFGTKYIKEGRMEEKIRVHAIISGRVQGVCFRLETQQAAEQCGVFGWVRNRREGTVEAVFEGTQEQVNSILEWCKKGPPISKVNKIDIHREPYTGEFKDFTITLTV